MLGIRLSVGDEHLQSRKRKDAPLGTVRLLDVASAKTLKSTDLTAYKQIYRSLGVTNERLAQWETENGYWSLGKSKSGQFLVPGFSKVAWMYIDPVTLTPQEAEELVQECVRAEALADDPIAKEELRRIRELAQEAVSLLGIIRFDQP